MGLDNGFVEHGGMKGRKNNGVVIYREDSIARNKMIFVLGTMDLWLKETFGTGYYQLKALRSGCRQ